MNLNAIYYEHRNIISTLLVYSNTREYKELDINTIDWRWEERDVNWDGIINKYYGFVPYVNEQPINLYIIKQNSDASVATGNYKKFFMSYLQCDGGSKTLLSEHYERFNLTEPVMV